MATFKIHPEFSTVTPGWAHLSVTFFARNEVHDTRDPQKCVDNPHTTRVFDFAEGTTRDDVHAELQKAADEWAASVQANRDRQAKIEGLL